MSLDTYRERVDNLAREQKGAPVYSGSHEQASILVEKIFASANEHIWILSDDLNARVYGPGEVLEQIRLFLADRRHRLRILLEVDTLDDLKTHPFLERFGYYENVEIRLLSRSIQSRYRFHFVVTDDNSYRFQPEKDKQPSVAAFGDKDGASRLREIFSILWKSGNPVDIPAPSHLRMATA